MKHPLLSVVLLLVGGVLLGRFVEISVALWLASGLACCVIALRSERQRVWALPLLIVLCGAANISVHRHIISPVDLRIIAPEADELVTVQGSVVRVVQKPEREIDRDKPKRYAAQIQLNHLRLKRGEWVPASGRLLASLEFAGADEVVPGQVIQLFGILSRPAGPLARGMFDYREHLANRGIYFQLRSEEPSDLVVLKPTATPWIVGFRKWAMSSLGAGFPPDDPSIELLWAMCLGWRTALTDEVAEPFMRSGTIHLFLTHAA